MSNQISEIVQLSVAERIQLVEDIWDSVAAFPEAVELTEAQQQELDRRLQAYKQNPHEGISWEDLKEATVVMKRQVIFRPEAALDVQEAFEWYEEQSVGLGFEFLRAADASLSAIQRMPFSFPIVGKQASHALSSELARRALLRKFPYFLLYLVEPDRIHVLACFHVRRDPTDWLNRIKP